MLDAGRCTIRPYRESDVAELPAVAGAFEVARRMLPTFPHPYTENDARAWVEATRAEEPTNNFAIDLRGVLIGGIGIRPRDGASAGVADFGYWLGVRYWGRGLATEAARAFCAYAFEQRRLRRLEANVFADNGASARVLEKCGFVREAVLREAYVDRTAAITDALLYALLRPRSKSA